MLAIEAVCVAGLKWTGIGVELMSMAVLIGTAKVTSTSVVIVISARYGEVVGASEFTIKVTGTLTSGNAPVKLNWVLKV